MNVKSLTSIAAISAVVPNFGARITIEDNPDGWSSTFRKNYGVGLANKFNEGKAKPDVFVSNTADCNIYTGEGYQPARDMPVISAALRTLFEVRGFSQRVLEGNPLHIKADPGVGVWRKTRNTVDAVYDRDTFGRATRAGYTCDTFALDGKKLNAPTPTLAKKADADLSDAHGYDLVYLPEAIEKHFSIQLPSALV